MNADMILDAFERVEDRFIMEAKGCVSADMTDAGSTEKRGRGLKRAAVLAAALAALLALCGFSDEDVRRGAVSQLMQKV